MLNVNPKINCFCVMSSLKILTIVLPIMVNAGRGYSLPCTKSQSVNLPPAIDDKDRSNTAQEILECQNKATQPNCFRMVAETEAILESIKYRKERMFDPVYNEMLTKTTRHHHILNKCTLKICLKQLIRVGLGHIIPKENIAKLTNERWEERPKLVSKLHGYQKAYFNYLRINKHVQFFVMNLNGWCPARMCIDDLKRNGFVNIYGNKNKSNLIDSKLTEDDYFQMGETAQKYKTHLIRAQPNKAKDLDVFCLEIICLVELTQAGFNSDGDAIANKTHFEKNPKRVNGFKIHYFVSLYVLHLEGSLLNENLHGSFTFCEIIATHGIFPKEM